MCRVCEYVCVRTWFVLGLYLRDVVWCMESGGCPGAV